MGVYIDMEMPKNCRRCQFQSFEECGVDYHDVSEACYIGEYDTSCPLVPVPPHYDLIDHNALKIAVMNCDCETRVDFLKHTMDCINKAPVVIPSDMPTYEEEGEA